MKNPSSLAKAGLAALLVSIPGVPAAFAIGGQCIGGTEATQVAQRMRQIQDELRDKCENPLPSRLANHPCHDSDSPVTEVCGPLCPEPDERESVKSGALWMSIPPDPAKDQYCMLPRRKKALEAIPGGNISEVKAATNFQALRADWIRHFQKPQDGARAVLTRYKASIEASIADPAHTPELDQRLPKFGNRTVRELLRETLESIRIYIVRGDELASNPALESMRADGVQETYNRMIFGCEHPDINQTCKNAPPSEVYFSINDLGTFLSGGDHPLVKWKSDGTGRMPPTGTNGPNGQPLPADQTNNPHYLSMETIRDDVHDKASDLFYRMNELDMVAGCRELRGEWNTLVARAHRFCSGIQNCASTPDDYFSIGRQAQDLADQASAALLKAFAPLNPAVAHPDTQH